MRHSGQRSTDGPLTPTYRRSSRFDIRLKAVIPNGREMTQMQSYFGSGVVLTVTICLLAGMIMLGPLVGDCLPEMGHSCPPDHERNLSVLWIALAAAGINVAAVWLMIHLHQRDDT